ncbi:unnamed protein product [Nippostrongylus brasiliensis]|uniref:Integrase_H2C2 domain-containing protein n=1 Tax=Nippostrongylus brasiliensis TaxID=27835 RepID=A0A0N4YFS8_NIPBR|nr:unnamed protein product [Nippostrongylus brasiliensis]
MCRVREEYWIPQLRTEATKIIRRCVNCQKLNNLPFKYPEQSHLPERLVTRSRPIAHVGLDYFGPLLVKNEDQVSKCYGCIITCLVTRLIHLDVVSEASTVAFLQMMRRFFSRRGVPISITCDNSPTFSLGETWRMGRISELIKNSEGTVREAVLATPSHRKIRRPLNLLIPLELDEEDNTTESQELQTHQTEDEKKDMEGHHEGVKNSRYNLRPRTNTSTILILTTIAMIIGKGEGLSNAPTKSWKENGTGIRGGYTPVTIKKMY